MSKLKSLFNALSKRKNTAALLFGLCLHFLMLLPSFSLQAQQLYPLSDDTQKAKIEISEAYPNPASQVLNFAYQLENNSDEAKVLIHNLLGSLVAEIKLSAFDAQVQIPVSEYKAGIYFYTISVNNQNIVTKKFIIKH
ncbi:T9SS type A sorting domain-containing protein [Hugenholtzia roseola]|uniref:T9SS type A sorting domain-containing protein n=1 Tax=Hugenholtzia roseola TaxID=1002 RepID=UPI0004269E02|nr:T9SS type A sorting domain-containing protein [Hugenholtzia roseola]